MDVLRIQSHFNEIRTQEHSSRTLLDSSSITDLLTGEDEKNICSSRTTDVRDEGLGTWLNIKSEITSFPGIWSRPYTIKRKHEECVNPLNICTGDVDHSPSSAHIKEQPITLSFLVSKHNAAYNQGISNKMNERSRLELPSKLLIPEGCGDSDLTAEPQMAESSKSSACFDDACTLALDSGVTAAESITTTGMHQFVDETKNKVSDLNNLLPVKYEHEKPGDQIADQSKDSCTTDKLASFSEQHFNKTENFMQVTNQNPQTLDIRASVSEECCITGIDNKSWLQLGLGPGAGVKSRPHFIVRKDNKDRVYDGTKTDEPKPRVTFQSKHSTSRKGSPGLSSINWPTGSFTGCDADQRCLPTMLGSNLNKVSTKSAYESMYEQAGARERGGKLMLVGDTISSLPSHRDSASDCTAPIAYMHQTGDPRSITLKNLRPFLQLPAACDENVPGIIRANHLQQPYQVPVPAEGAWTKSSQLISEHQQLHLSCTNSRSMQQRHSIQSRLGIDLPGQIYQDAAVTASGEGRLIDKQPQTLSQEWQQVARRFGTDVHFQPPLPEGLVTSGKSNSFQVTIQDLEMAAIQQTNYATINRYLWSEKDFRMPMDDPLGHPTTTGYLSSTSHIPINHMKSLKNAANERTTLIQQLPCHITSVSESHVQLPEIQRAVARHTISAENLKLADCNERRRPGLWFMLQASDNPSRPMDFALPQIPKGYLRVKDESVSVSDVKKYLANKLGVACDSEVEIFCKGKSLDSSLSLQCVRNTIWFEHANSEEIGDQGGENNVRDIASTRALPLSNGAIMVLMYQRKIPSLNLR